MEVVLKITQIWFRFGFFSANFRRGFSAPSTRHRSSTATSKNDLFQEMDDSIDPVIVDQLATGFGALLEQVQELDKENAHLKSLLDRMQEQVCGSGNHPMNLYW